MKDLGTHFEEKLLHVRRSLLLRNGFGEEQEQGEKLLHSVAASLSELQAVVVAMKKELSHRRRALESVEVNCLINSS